MKKEEFDSVINLLGVKRADIIVNRFGGNVIYIPKADSVKRAKRNRRLREEFNGNNHNELARKYSLSATQVRNIVQSDIKNDFPKSYHDLEKVLGAQSAKQLCIALGGCEVFVPRFRG
jgi:hypothetical protein